MVSFESLPHFRRGTDLQNKKIGKCRLPNAAERETESGLSESHSAKKQKS